MADSSPHAAVIIPVHNGERFLPACLAALFAQAPPPLAVIAVDNGSADAGADLIARRFPQVRLIRSDAPLGFAGACNAGIRAALEAEGEPPGAIVLLNQDTVVDPGWLRALLRPLEDPRVGVVGSLARFPDGRVQHAGAEILEPLGYGRNLEAIDDGRWAPDERGWRVAHRPPSIVFLAAFATAYRAAMLQEIGLLDEGFSPAYFEDADLCLRAAAAGWKLALAPGATLVHHEGAVTVEGAGQARAYAHAAALERNRLRLALKHRDPDALLGPFLAAERAQLLRRAHAGDSQPLRQAYLRALLSLPEIVKARGLPTTTQAALARALAELRDAAGARERETRLFGLGAAASRPGDQGAGEPSARVHPRIPAPPRPALPASPPPVAIVMLTWNGLAYTQACIASLREHTRDVPYRLIVVDNGSADGTREWLREQPDVTLIENATNAGFTRGNNQGMAAAPPGHDILLLNNDTLITQGGWLARLREVAHAAPERGIVGCVLLHTNGLLQHAGTAMPTDTFWGYQVGGGEPYVGQYPGVREVEGITGACMYIRRDLYDAIGGFDEAFFSYYEDTDYCLRARQAGYTVVCVGDVRITHHENTSTRQNNADWRAMFGAAQQIFREKWRAYYEGERYSRALLWHSLIAQPTGYATSSREFVRELDRRGVDVRLACVFGTDYTEPPTGDPRVDQLLKRPKDMSLPQVVYSQGDAFVKNSGRYRVGFTMLEADGLPEDWVNQANQMDEVWTPTAWGAEVFQASGVTRPIHVIPLGVDPNYFHPEIQGRRASSRYTFLSVFDWIERKAPELLLRAYLKTFSARDDVLLVLKVSSTDPHFDVRRHIRELVGDAPSPPVAVLLNQEIAPAQLGSLYRSADCFVLPTRGEGWGMPTLEAMACGLPVISTGWGAQTAFLHAGVGYPLGVRGLVPAVARSPYYAGLRWADPDFDQLCDLMRYVYENPGEARAIGARAAAEVRECWTWERAVDRIIARLDAIGG